MKIGDLFVFFYDAGMQGNCGHFSLVSMRGLRVL
jgi:hypothetical protein